MDDKRTVWTWLADWLAVRRPTRLVADGVFLMMWGGVAYVVWSLWWELNADALRAAASRLDRTMSLTMSSAYHGLFWLGVVFVAVGCSRVIAEGGGRGDGER